MRVGHLEEDATDRLVLVVVSSSLYGDSFGILRRLSTAGLVIEMCFAPPVGTELDVHFQHLRLRDNDGPDEIIARCTVVEPDFGAASWTGDDARPHDRAIAMRVVAFGSSTAPIAASRIH